MFKLLALFLMTLDHIGVYFRPLFPEEIYLFLRMVGRLSFPMFAYSVVKGIYFTKNIYRYLGRLTFFALLTQLLLDVTAYYTNRPSITNVLFTFVLGVLFCITLDCLSHTDQISGTKITNRLHRHPSLRGPLCLISLTVIHLITFFLQPDYDFYGLYTIYIYKRIFDAHPEVWGPTAANEKTLRDLKPVFLSFLVFHLIYLMLEWPLIVPFSQNTTYALLQHISILHIFFLPLEHRAEKYSKCYQYSFYFYYPLHICLFLLLSQSII